MADEQKLSFALAESAALQLPPPEKAGQLSGFAPAVSHASLTARPPSPAHVPTNFAWGSPPYEPYTSAPEADIGALAHPYEDAYAASSSIYEEYPSAYPGMPESLTPRKTATEPCCAGCANPGAVPCGGTVVLSGAVPAGFQLGGDGDPGPGPTDGPNAVPTWERFIQHHRNQGPYLPWPTPIAPQAACPAGGRLDFPAGCDACRDDRGVFLRQCFEVDVGLDLQGALVKAYGCYPPPPPMSNSTTSDWITIATTFFQAAACVLTERAGTLTRIVTTTLPSPQTGDPPGLPVTTTLVPDARAFGQPPTVYDALHAWTTLPDPAHDPLAPALEQLVNRWMAAHTRPVNTSVWLDIRTGTLRGPGLVCRFDPFDPESARARADACHSLAQTLWPLDTHRA